MSVASRESIEKLLSQALGNEVNLTPKRLTKQQRLQKQIDALRQKQVERISKGRTKGAGAGGFNRDIDNISHQIRLLQIKLSEIQ